MLTANNRIVEAYWGVAVTTGSRRQTFADIVGLTELPLVRIGRASNLERAKVVTWIAGHKDTAA